MQLIKEEITEEFLENMVNKVINRLTAKLEDIDISIDFLASILSAEAGATIGVRQKNMGRHGRPVRRSRVSEEP